jgi:hypothetical protein
MMDRRAFVAGILTLLAAPVTAEAQLSVVEPLRRVLDQTILGLTEGNVDAVSGLFRYFEERIDEQRALRDRRLVKLGFSSFRRSVGTPSGFEPIKTMSSPYVNVFVESADGDLWRSSSCVFQTNALGADLVRERERRRAEVLFELCLDRAMGLAWLKRVDVHVPSPSRDLLDRMTRFTYEMQRALREP